MQDKKQKLINFKREMLDKYGTGIEGLLNVHLLKIIQNKSITQHTMDKIENSICQKL